MPLPHPLRLRHSGAVLVVTIVCLTAAGCSEDPFGPNGAAASLAVGLFHSCALEPSGEAWCWGSNLSGQIGDGAGGDGSTPVHVDFQGSFMQLDAGFLHTCGLDTEGRPYCWGDNSVGQLGDQTIMTRIAPVAVAGGYTFDRVRTGGYHTCALTADGVPYCWGANNNGQLGVLRSNTLCQGAPCELQPTPVESGLVLTELSAGYGHTCGLTADGAAYCWGNNTTGQLGNGYFTSVARPVLVTAEARFTKISAGRNHTCALTAEGQAYCWGLNANKQLGSEGSNDQCLNTLSCTSHPLAVETDVRFKDIAAGGDHTCAISDDDRAYCWGQNDAAQLGLGDISLDQLHPVVVPGSLRFAAIGAGDLHTCALTVTAQVYCWGDNLLRQMGQGARGIYYPDPVLVSIPPGP